MATEDSGFVANYKEYVDIYNKFCRSRREQEKIWVEQDFVPKVQDVFIRGNPTPRSEFKILAVGSNEGSFDCLFIKALFSHAKELMEGKEVVYTVVEPNAVAIDEFKRNVSSQDTVFQRNVRFNWVNKRMEEFLAVTEPERYDVIQFMHVLYYAESEEEILRSAYEKFLERPGCIVAAIATEKTIWLRLKEAFKTKIPTMVYKVPTNIEVSEICKRNRWRYELFDAKLELEVTEVFNDEDPVGQAILKFFLHINEEPIKKLGKDIVAEVMEFLRKMSWERMKDGKKSLFVNEDEGLLLIYKRS